ncbi:BolA family protein [Dentiradicibacter hellwigii]|uniref:BolA family protein n=1 Tax=Dentiradicibacter hellwigii TaxID=3149053 RepID=A0ABV4UBV5_9RHOO
MSVDIAVTGTETMVLLRERLKSLSPQSLEIIDESALHAGHAGTRNGGHYRLYIVSPAFAGKTMLARHRLVHETLGELMHGRIHALGITALAPEECRPG